MAAPSMSNELWDLILPYNYTMSVLHLTVCDVMPQKYFVNQELSRTHWLDVRNCYKQRRKNSHHVFEIFARYNSDTPENIRQTVIGMIKLEKNYYNEVGHHHIKKSKMSIDEWLKLMSFNAVFADELMIFTLCRTFQRHCVILTSTGSWTTVGSDEPIAVRRLLEICDITLLYIGAHMFGEVKQKLFITTVKPVQGPPYLPIPYDNSETQPTAVDLTSKCMTKVVATASPSDSDMIEGTESDTPYSNSVHVKQEQSSSDYDSEPSDNPSESLLSGNMLKAVTTIEDTGEIGINMIADSSAENVTENVSALGLNSEVDNHADVTCSTEICDPYIDAWLSGALEQILLPEPGFTEILSEIYQKTSTVTKSTPVILDHSYCATVNVSIDTTCEETRQYNNDCEMSEVELAMRCLTVQDSTDIHGLSTVVETSCEPVISINMPNTVLTADQLSSYNTADELSINQIDCVSETIDIEHLSVDNTYVNCDVTSINIHDEMGLNNHSEQNENVMGINTINNVPNIVDVMGSNNADCVIGINNTEDVMTVQTDCVSISNDKEHSSVTNTYINCDMTGINNHDEMDLNNQQGVNKSVIVANTSDNVQNTEDVMGSNNPNNLNNQQCVNKGVIITLTSDNVLNTEYVMGSNNPDVIGRNDGETPCYCSPLSIGN